MFAVKVGDKELRIGAKYPDEAAPIRGDDKLLRRLSTEMGLHGLLGRSNSPEALIAALINSGLPYEIVEGAEILDLPIKPLPKGAIY